MAEIFFTRCVLTASSGFNVRFSSALNLMFSSIRISPVFMACIFIAGTLPLTAIVDILHRAPKQLGKSLYVSLQSG